MPEARENVEGREKSTARQVAEGFVNSGDGKMDAERAVIKTAHIDAHTTIRGDISFGVEDLFVDEDHGAVEGTFAVGDDVMSEHGSYLALSLLFVIIREAVLRQMERGGIREDDVNLIGSDLARWVGLEAEIWAVVREKVAKTMFGFR